MKRKMFSVLSTAALVMGLFAGAPVQAGDEITADNWAEKTGFKPDLSRAGDVKKGKKVTEKNLEKYEHLLPPMMKLLIKKYGLKMKLRPYEPIHPSTGYIEATNKYRGQAKIIDVGDDYRKRGLEKYTAGLPFPDPKTGLEIAWNYHYGYNGDDADTYFNLLWISAASGVEHTEVWRWAYIIRTINRTDLDPIPAIESFVKKRLQYTSITYALEPYDKKGFGAVYSRSVDPLDQQGHIYVPAMRRILRNTFGTRGDTWNSTDLLYEDVRGYMGYPEWMHWKLVGKKTLLAPMHAGVALGKGKVGKAFDLEKPPHWNPIATYEPRPTYVVEVRPKFPDYPYKKMLLYIDAETFLITYKECFDKKDDLWKVMVLAWNESPDMDEHPPILGSGAVMDLQADHATLFHWNKVKTNIDMNPKMFTLSNLRKRGR